MERKIVKCPNCRYEVDVSTMVRRKHCIKCGYLMKDVE